jgi:hypothetical protein
MNKSKDQLQNLLLSFLGTCLALAFSVGPLANAAYVMHTSREFLPWHQGWLAALAAAHHGWVFAVLCGSIVLIGSTIGCWLSIMRSTPVYILSLGPALSEAIGVACSGVGTQAVVNLKTFGLYAMCGALAGIALTLLVAFLTDNPSEPEDVMG